MGSERARTDRAGRHRVEAKRCGWCLLQNRMAEVCRVVTTTCPAGSYLVWGDSCGLAAGGSRARSSTMPSGASDGELDLLSALGLTAGEGASAVADASCRPDRRLDPCMPGLNPHFPSARRRPPACKTLLLSRALRRRASGAPVGSWKGK